MPIDHPWRRQLGLPVRAVFDESAKTGRYKSEAWRSRAKLLEHPGRGWEKDNEENEEKGEEMKPTEKFWFGFSSVYRSLLETGSSQTGPRNVGNDAQFGRAPSVFLLPSSLPALSSANFPTVNFCDRIFRLRITPSQDRESARTPTSRRGGV